MSSGDREAWMKFALFSEIPVARPWTRDKERKPSERQRAGNR
jgi:hypothetical protein